MPITITGGVTFTGSGVGDTYFPYVPLLLESTSTNAATNNTFLDSSTNNYTITRSGTPTQGSFTPYWPNGQWSNYFGTANTDYLSPASSATLAFGTNAYTVEFWIYLPAYTVGDNRILDLGSANGSFAISIGSTARVSVAKYGAVNVFDSNASFTLNTWNHVAVVRTSTATSGLSIYLNGTNIGTGTDANNWTVVNTPRINGLAGFSFGWVGYLSNLRIVNGTAVYTGNFTVPTTPLAATQSAGTNIAAITGTATSLLTCQSNRFIDNSTNASAITSSGTPRTQTFQPLNPSVSYTAETYGGSIYNTVKTDTLTATSTSALTTFTGDFTFECWVYPTDTSLTSSWGIIDTRTSGQTSAPWVWGLGSYTSAGWTLGLFLSNAASYSFTQRVLPYTWTHVVLQRNGTTVRSFVNGVVDPTTATISGTITGGSSTVAINNSKDSSLGSYGNIGYTSNLRMVNGTAVYTTTGFTPPTSPVTAITNTSLLLNYTNAGIYDASVQNNGITVSSAQASTTQYKWSPSSMKFNGTTDYLSMVSNPALNLGTGSFTVEAWINLSAMSSDYFVISAAGTGGAFFGFQGSTNIGYGRNAVAWDYTVASGMSVGVWYHIAWCRSSTSMRIFVNGTQVGTTQTTSQAYDLTTTSTNVANQGLYYLNGYIQDLRITKGIARYTANFSVPTAAFPTGPLALSGVTISAPLGLSTVEYLVVGGGGGGGTINAGGGGGGYAQTSSLSIATGTSYTVTVGVGGAANTIGSDSVFSSITSSGGGKGGNSDTIGGNGGNGGGGGGGTPNTAGTATQGFAGGNGALVSGKNPGGGGGGTTSVGIAAAGSVAGNGGAGLSSSITGVSVSYGGGGGGGVQGGTVGTGDGGGGNGGSNSNGSPGTANTGGGGGGGGGSGPGTGGAGGSGVVIIAYPSNFDSLSSISVGLTYTFDNGVTRSGYKVYKFTAGTGTIQW
jgi:hypothetical protein